MGFANPSPAPAFTPAPAPTLAPDPALVTTGGAGVEEGKWMRHAWQRNWTICEVEL